MTYEYSKKCLDYMDKIEQASTEEELTEIEAAIDEDFKNGTLSNVDWLCLWSMSGSKVVKA